MGELDHAWHRCSITIPIHWQRGHGGVRADKMTRCSVHHIRSPFHTIAEVFTQRTFTPQPPSPLEKNSSGYISIDSNQSGWMESLSACSSLEFRNRKPLGRIPRTKDSWGCLQCLDSLRCAPNLVPNLIRGSDGVRFSPLGINRFPSSVQLADSFTVSEPTWRMEGPGEGGLPKPSPLS